MTGVAPPQHQGLLSFPPPGNERPAAGHKRLSKEQIVEIYGVSEEDYGKLCDDGEGIMKVLLCNSTCWKSAKAVLETTNAEVVMLQEHKLASWEALVGAQAWASKISWAVPATPASWGKKAHTKAGAALAVRSHIGTSAWPGTKPRDATLSPGRAAGVKVSRLATGGIWMISAYFKDGIGMTGVNGHLMDDIHAALKLIKGPWILGADFNCEPKELVTWAKGAGRPRG